MIILNFFRFRTYKNSISNFFFILHSINSKKIIKHYSQLIKNFRISLPPGSSKNLESVTRTFTAPAKKVTLHLTPRPGPWKSCADPIIFHWGSEKWKLNSVFRGLGWGMYHARFLVTLLCKLCNRDPPPPHPSHSRSAHDLLHHCHWHNVHIRVIIARPIDQNVFPAMVIPWRKSVGFNITWLYTSYVILV